MLCFFLNRKQVIWSFIDFFKVWEQSGVKMPDPVRHDWVKIKGTWFDIAMVWHSQIFVMLVEWLSWKKSVYPEKKYDTRQKKECSLSLDWRCRQISVMSYVERRNWMSDADSLILFTDFIHWFEWFKDLPRLPIIYVAPVVCWTPSRQPAIEGGHAIKHVITGQSLTLFWQNYTPM